jgi:hypothetical protein
MPNLSYKLTLTSEGVSSGPYYNVTYTTASVYYPVLAGTPAYLPNVSSSVVVSIPSGSFSYLAFNLNNGIGGDCELCNNNVTLVVTGSVPTTSTTTTTTTAAPTTSTTTTTTTAAPTTSTTTTTTTTIPYNYYTFTPCTGGAGTDYRSISALALNDVYAFQASPPDRACYTITSITAGVNSNDLPTIYGPKSDCNDDDCQQL